MKLFYSHASPFARKVNMALHVTNQIHECELILSTFETTELRDQNPLGKIPALIDGNRTLFESSIICEYLVEKASQRQGDAALNLFKRDNEDYWDIQTAHALANGITEAAVATIMESKRNTEHSQYWLERWKAAIDTGIQSVNIKNLGDKNAINIATLAMVAALGYIDFRLPHYEWRAHNTALELWYSSISKENWAIKTQPK